MQTPDRPGGQRRTGPPARITFALPADHRRRLEALSVERDLSVAQLCRRAVGQMLTEGAES